MMGKKAINIVNYQFTKMKILNDVILGQCMLNPKKILDLMENCPPLKPFFDSLEKRDKKYLMSFSQIYEIQPNVLN